MVHPCGGLCQGFIHWRRPLFSRDTRITFSITVLTDVGCFHLLATAKLLCCKRSFVFVCMSTCFQFFQGWSCRGHVVIAFVKIFILFGSVVSSLQHVGSAFQACRIFCWGTRTLSLGCLDSQVGVHGLQLGRTGLVAPRHVGS